MCIRDSSCGLCTDGFAQTDCPGLVRHSSSNDQHVTASSMPLWRHLTTLGPTMCWLAVCGFTWPGHFVKEL
eukprot:12925530-Prorocentrum_lima.AAC.1